MAGSLRGRGLLLAGAALLVGGVALAVGLFVHGLSSMSSAIDDGHRVPGAGGAMELTPGHYKVFIEGAGTYGSNGSGFDDDPADTLPTPTIRVTGPDGLSVPAPNPSFSESYTVNGRSGRTVAAFTAAQPGSYRVQADSPTAGQLYVTQHGVFGSVASSLAGVFGGGGLALLGLVLVIVGLVQRTQPRTPHPGATT